MGHIHHQIGSASIGDLAEALEVENARIARATGDDHLGLDVEGLRFEQVIVDQVIVLAHLVGLVLFGEVESRSQLWNKTRDVFQGEDRAPRGVRERFAFKDLERFPLGGVSGFLDFLGLLLGTNASFAESVSENGSKNLRALFHALWRTS